MPSRTSSAFQTILTLLAVAAGGFLILLLALLIAGPLLLGPPAMDPALAGLAVGRQAPAIEAAGWVNGEPATSDRKVTVVQGWFYNCPYCWEETPHLVELHKKYGDKVAFVGLTTDEADDLDLVEEFVAKNKVTYPVGYGAGETLVRGFETQAFPVVWVLGKDGTVVWNRANEGDRSLEEAIEAALAGGQEA